ncbi:MAG: T9SS type A sorting domain-containing protein [Bacteroidetes bacterium]|nr:T9SS type A sorting domain-containing protein [Bacteroidota bacterium]
MKTILCIVFLVFSIAFSANAQWVKVQDATSYTSVFSGSSSGFLYTTSYGGVYRSGDNGGNWIFMNPGIQTGTAVTSVSANDSLVFASTSSALYKSSNSGVNWTLVLNGYTGINSIYRTGNYVFFNTYTSISRSTNNGISFSYANSGLPSNPNLQFITGSSGRLYAAGISSNGVYTSTNNGDNWSKAGTEIPSGIGTYSLFASDNIVMAGTDNGVYISTNYGANWRLIPGILGAYGYYGLARSGNRLFISAWGSGVYASTNLGQNWIAWNQGISGGLCNGMYYYGNYVFCGTITAIYRRPVSDVGIKFTGEGIPENFKLFQNYPNPFNPVTKIRFQIPAKTGVQIAVYDVKGRLVQMLIDEEIKAGMYEITYDGSGLGSGTYFCVMTAGEFKEVKKLILIK